MTARIVHGGEQIDLLPWRAAWWRPRRWLIVSDLHLGRAETLAADGVAAPRGVADADLSRLAAGSAGLSPERIVIVGDLIHAGRGLTDELVAAVAGWRDRIDAEMVLVRGNHDRALRDPPASWRLISAGPELRESGLVFVHDPEDAGDAGGAVCGHVHPVVIAGGRADAVRLPCFALVGGRLILPAFGLFTGGRAVRLSADDRAFAIAGDRVVEVPRPDTVADRAGRDASPRAGRRVR